jgi:Ran GTPase-activating protein (RanGAP) involved in mRNA processing and transport
MDAPGPEEEWLTRIRTNDPQLTALSLRGEDIGNNGVRALAEALSENNTLTLLDLELTNMTDEGACVLARVFETNATIKSVDLASNSIGDVGARAIAAALPKNTTLTFIDLGSNNIDVGGTSGLSVFSSSARKLACSRLHQSVSMGGAGMSLPVPRAPAEGLLKGRALSLLR